MFPSLCDAARISVFLSPTFCSVHLGFGRPSTLSSICPPDSVGPGPAKVTRGFKGKYGATFLWNKGACLFNAFPLNFLRTREGWRSFHRILWQTEQEWGTKVTASIWLMFEHRGLLWEVIWWTIHGVLAQGSLGKEERKLKARVEAKNSSLGLPSRPLEVQQTVSGPCSSSAVKEGEGRRAGEFKGRPCCPWPSLWYYKLSLSRNTTSDRLSVLSEVLLRLADCWLLYYCYYYYNHYKRLLRNL